MDAELSVRQRHHAVIVDVSGDWKSGPGTQAIREKIWQLVEAGHKQIVLNLSAVTHLRRDAALELVAAYHTVTFFGGEMKFLKMSKPTLKLVSAANPRLLSETFQEEAAAVNSFRNNLPPLNMPLQNSHSEIYIG